MTLGELIGSASQAATARSVRVVAGGDALGLEVSGVACDSRKVTPGSVFVALTGHHADGLQFVPQALARGAVAVVSEAEPPADLRAPWVVVPDARRAVAALSAAVYGHPSREMTVVGITGTNGKTTTAYLLSAVFETAGIKCGILGTVVYRVGNQEQEASRTTPEAPDVQRLLREMAAAGCGACAMEVSSHALALHRVDGTRFAAAVFTNLTRDHLDFHGDMEAYFLAKRRLFELLPQDGVAVINADDARGEALAVIGHRTVTYAIDRAADIKADDISLALDGMAFKAQTPSGPITVRSRLVGRPNVYNALATVATGVGLGIEPEIIARGLATVTGVPGRFQVVSEPGDDVTVVVDYAHTDDALKNLLETARPLATRQLITVFGCGGDRDRTKRPLMGAVAARLSDVVVVTSDNPRSEDPSAIIDEVKRGIAVPVDRNRPAEPPRNGQQRSSARAPQLLTIVDRRAAIERAVGSAGAGDVVLIAGKGHEKHQEVSDKVLPFDDVEVARAALARRRGSVARLSRTNQIDRSAIVGAGSVGVTEARTTREIVLTADAIARAMGGRLEGGRPHTRIEGVSIDSRTLARGDLFIAIRGDRLDGHAYVKAAIAAGAVGAVVAGDAESAVAVWPPEAVLIRVDDTTRALQALARHVRRASESQVVAITGSTGKTTTKETAAAFLGRQYRVHRSSGNLNNHIGLPLSLLQLRARPDIAVVELGMSHAGEIRTLVAVAEPNIRVWTNVAEVHSAFFSSLDAIAEAKAEILEGAGPRGVLVANADDSLVMERARRFAGVVRTFGTDPSADIRASGIEELGLDGTAATLRTPAGTRPLRTPLLGLGNLANVLAAAAVALHYEVPLDSIVETAAGLQPLSHRGQVLRLAGGVTLVDDSYNSNPRALELALQAVEREQRCARRVAVLGEMLELGARASALHQACGQAAAAAGLAALVTVGGEPARALGAAAVRAGMGASAVWHVATSEDAADTAITFVRPGDLVLVKGSRGIRTDLVVERLMEEFG